MTTRTDVQRLGRLLTRRLEAAGISRDEGVSVEDLQRRLLPYHLCRSELGLTTKAEYDLLMLELIDRSGFLAMAEPRLATAVRKERTSPEPGLAFLRQFASTRLELLEALTADASEPSPDTKPVSRPAARPRAGTGSLSARIRPAHPRRPSAPGATRPSTPPRRQPDSCWSCAEALPDRSGLRYCPHCGVDQRYRPCSCCDAELEHGWAFCPLCGEPTTGRS